LKEVPNKVKDLLEAMREQSSVDEKHETSKKLENASPQKQE